jgi:predicted O-methyltransferase YrrM
MVKIKSIISKAFRRFGYSISRVPTFDGSYDPYCRIPLQSGKIVDLEALGNIALSIPGMIAPRSGQLLYTMCYLQALQGDVVEIGSWQGRSTSFLARAVKNSGNGHFYAIDHFRGNVGKEHFYVVNEDDLSDLEAGFQANMERIGLNDSIKLFNMSNEEACHHLEDSKVRFLFIDGDHTKEGVQKDLELFFPKLMPGAIIVFDDFRSSLTGLVEAVDEFMLKHSFARKLSYGNTLVLML